MHLFTKYLFFLFLLFTYSNINAEQPQSFKFYAQESPNWSKPTIESSNWLEFDRNVRAYPKSGIFWLEIPISLEIERPPQKDWELTVHMLAAYDVYFNDELIGNNGMPSMHIEGEQPGMVWNSFLVPDHMIKAGHHKLRFKASTHYSEPNMKLTREIWLKPYDAESKYIRVWSLIPALLVSIASVVGLYFLFLFFSDDKQYEHLIFFVLLQGMMVYGYAIQWDHLVGYDYSSEITNLLVEQFSSITVLYSLPIYFLLKHKVAYWWVWIIGASFTTVIAMNYVDLSDEKILWGCSFLLSLYISIWYGALKQSRFWLESMGIAVCLVAIFMQNLEDLFIYFPILFSFILLTQAINTRERRIALKEAEYIQAKLNAELLKKHIQPHFLLNTLTSLMEWVETDVDKSMNFIALLGDEFRMMAQMSNKRLVPLSSEIDLCEKHLSLMSMRLDCECELSKNICNGQVLIPPGILHTLIENAFTHNVFTEQKLIFQLIQTKVSLTEYSIRLTTPKSKNRTSEFRKIGAGTGTKYIEARLNQCFGKHWQFSVDETEETFTTDIRINYLKIKQ
ncbi:hypothetical protein DRW07_07615 [Alteromonas sediminis]|uniref:Signal transduction histidine kinase internal region domain-containing protein n=1 Tax=Alteromonas sediminis TaxID=2259342 RepID=A0A3N5Y1A6_9ALTE|nr:histidine kinase [Alteromonas sediminis]RPJ67382.1 hypothetical protein DRW07_07615 [Alteromonas sediminis]